MNKIYECTDAEFINLIKTSLNIKEVLFKLNLTSVGNSWGYSQVKQRMSDLGLSGLDFKAKSGIRNCNKENTIPDDKLFSSNSKHSRNIVRKRIITNKLLPYKCDVCGIKEWNNKTLSLELDHINGINYDNRLENLRFLCPNCHSQTTTYGSRNSDKTLSNKEIVLTEELLNLIESSYLELKSQKAVCRQLGLQTKVVRKAINKLGLNKLNQKFVIQKDAEGNEINRFGSIAEAARYLMDNNILKTKKIKVARTTLIKHLNTYWNNYYWMIVK